MQGQIIKKNVDMRVIENLLNSLKGQSAELAQYHNELRDLNLEEPFLHSFKKFAEDKWGAAVTETASAEVFNSALAIAETVIYFGRIINSLKVLNFADQNQVSEFLEECKSLSDMISRKVTSEEAQDISANIAGAMPGLERFKYKRQLELLAPIIRIMNDGAIKLTLNQQDDIAKLEMAFNNLMGGIEFHETTDLSSSVNDIFVELRERDYAYNGADSLFKDLRRRAYSLNGIDLLATYLKTTGTRFPTAQEETPEIRQAIHAELLKMLRLKDARAIEHVPQGVFGNIKSAIQGLLAYNSAFESQFYQNVSTYIQANFLTGNPARIRLTEHFNNINNTEKSILVDCTISCELTLAENGYYVLDPKSFTFSGYDADLLKKIFLGTATDAEMDVLLERARPINQNVSASMLNSGSLASSWRVLHSLINKEEQAQEGNKLKQIANLDIELIQFNKALYSLTAQLEADAIIGHTADLYKKTQYLSQVSELFSGIERKIKAIRAFNNKALVTEAFNNYKISFYDALIQKGTVFYQNLSSIEKIILMAKVGLSSLMNKTEVQAIRQAIQQEMLNAVDHCKTPAEVERLFNAYQQAKHEIPGNPLQELLVKWRRGVTA